MQILVNVNNIQIIKNDILNENEYNIHNIKFIFSTEYGDDLAKVALFSSESATYKIIISNDECNIPPEILAKKGCFTLGVYAFEVENDVLVERYSPTPLKINIEDGSYIPDEDTENSVPLTPTDKEQILDALSKIQIDSEQITKNAQDIAEIKEEQIEQNSAIEQLENQIPTKTSELINDSGFIPQSELTSAINEEKALRQNADNNLQSQIDAISASSDVIDVLGTYQDLQNYDTSHVKANDIIKVLQDSTHDNAQSYYRWVITDHTGAWQYVGSEAPTYTKSEINEKFQDVDSDISGISNDVDNIKDDIDTIEGNISDIEAEQITQNNRITELEEQVNDLENNQLTGTATGTSIDLEDSADARVRSIELKGNSVQNGEPTPTIPVEIYSAGDSGSIVEKIINKNWFDVNVIQERTTNGITMTFQEQTIHLEGTPTANANFYMKSGKSLELKAGTYYIERTSMSGIATLKLTSGGDTIVATGSSDISFTLQNDTSIDGLTLQVPSSVGTINKDIVIQLESGSTGTNYISHEEQTFTIPCQQPMQNVGDVRDYFIEIDGIWYERHLLGNILINGTQGTISKPTTNRFNIDNAIIDYLKAYNKTNYMSNQYICFSQQGNNAGFDALVSNVNYGLDLSSGSTSYTIRIKDTRYNDINDFKEWLSNNNLKIIYVLATPNDLLCTEEQIEALEEYVKARTYKTVTHIYSEDETPAYQEIVYVKDTESGINELIEAQIGDAIGGAY